MKLTRSQRRRKRGLVGAQRAGLLRARRRRFGVSPGRAARERTSVRVNSFGLTGRFEQRGPCMPIDWLRRLVDHGAHWRSTLRDRDRDQACAGAGTCRQAASLCMAGRPCCLCGLRCGGRRNRLDHENNGGRTTSGAGRRPETQERGTRARDAIIDLKLDEKSTAKSSCDEKLVTAQAQAQLCSGNTVDSIGVIKGNQNQNNVQVQGVGSVPPSPPRL